MVTTRMRTFLQHFVVLMSLQSLESLSTKIANRIPPPPTTIRKTTTISCSNLDSRRRQFLDTTASTAAALILLTTITPSVAYAATKPPPPPVSLERIRTGHARIQYLLDHWESITSVCGTTIMSDTERKQVVRTENGNTCTKTPLRVQEYMGYKNVNDPLYKIEKFLIQDSVMMRVADDVNDYLETVEQYKETADQTALLAYTSSWGEANPNGSKEAVDSYLEQTKVQVVQSEQLLRKLLGYLQLEPMTGPVKDGKV